MIPRFELHRPATIQEASRLLREFPGEAVPYAGGTELLQVMKLGLASFRHLVDVKGIPSLHGIDVTPDGWLRIGATSTHREIERSTLVASHVPALASLERQIANVRVRNTGTLGGNLCFAEPHSDPAAFLLAADGRVRLSSADAERELAIDDFVAGPLLTGRDQGELLVEVRVPPRVANRGHGFAKLAFFERPAASVACRIDLQGGRIAAVRVAVGSACEAPTLLGSIGPVLVGVRVQELEEALATARDAARDEVLTYDDINGSADYKRHLVGLLLGQAVTAAHREATRG